MCGVSWKKIRGLGYVILALLLYQRLWLFHLWGSALLYLQIEIKVLHLGGLLHRLLGIHCPHREGLIARGRPEFWGRGDLGISPNTDFLFWVCFVS